ncbi:MAG: DUF2269 family protein [Thermoleophilaceae bacterium]|nr:DUF2269 family protein [Thermoleophilaceae bacterium]
MSFLELLVFAHLAAAIAWVGGNTVIQLFGSRTINRGSPDEIQSFVGTLVWLTPRFFIPVSLATVGFGIAAALEASYSFGEPWISAGLTMFIVSFLIGIAYLGPQSERITKLGESEGTEAPAYAEGVKKLMFASRVELILLWVTVFLMVIRPG